MHELNNIAIAAMDHIFLKLFLILLERSREESWSREQSRMELCLCVRDIPSVVADGSLDTELRLQTEPSVFDDLTWFTVSPERVCILQ